MPARGRKRTGTVPRSTTIKERCYCSECIRSTYQDEHGIVQRGVLQERKVLNRHRARDSLAERKHSVQAEVAADAILLATVGDLPTRGMPAEEAPEVCVRRSSMTTLRPSL